MTILTSTIQVARKDYICNACCTWDRSGYNVNDVTLDQWREIVEAARSDNWKIKKGDKYLKQTYVDDGRLVTYRARIDMHGLCADLGFFEE